MLRRKLAVIFGEVPPWLVANFNASARLMEVVVVQVDDKRTVQRANAVPAEKQFTRVALQRPAEGLAPSAYLPSLIDDALNHIRPDAVMTLGWSEVKSIAALRWCLRHRVPAVVVSDSNRQDYARVWWKEAVKKRIVRLYSAAWAAGTLAAEYLSELGMPERAIVKGPVDTIDVRHFTLGAANARGHAAEVRAQRKLPQNYFFALSRFVVEKNLPTLLRAYSEYYQRAGHDAWSLVLAGDGPLRADVSRLIAQWNLGDKVLLPGWITFEALPDYYGLAGAFVHASTKDTWAVVVNEAMAAGLPVIVSNRCGCVPDLVRHGANGFVFDPGLPEPLAQLMWRVAHGDCDRAAMGAESYKIIQKWTPEEYALSLRNVVEVALQSPKPTPMAVDRALLAYLLN